MSRTDKTDPLWIRMTDPANRNEVREHHDHTKGPCDLDTYYAKRDGFWRRANGSCFLYPYPIRRLYCGCSWCHRRSWSDYEGAFRAEWQVRKRAWLKGWEDRRERDIRKY